MFVLDLGSHTVKIGVVPTSDDDSSEDLFSMSQFSCSGVDQSSSAISRVPVQCDEIPTLKGWLKLTSLNSMSVQQNAQQVTQSVRFGLDCLR